MDIGTAPSARCPDIDTDVTERERQMMAANWLPGMPCRGARLFLRSTVPFPDCLHLLRYSQQSIAGLRHKREQNPHYCDDIGLSLLRM
jgi:hypothetical protein